MHRVALVNDVYKTRHTGTLIDASHGGAHTIELDNGSRFRNEGRLENLNNGCYRSYMDTVTNTEFTCTSHSNTAPAYSNGIHTAEA